MIKKKKVGIKMLAPVFHRNKLHDYLPEDLYPVEDHLSGTLYWKEDGYVDDDFYDFDEYDDPYYCELCGDSDKLLGPITKMSELFYLLVDYSEVRYDDGDESYKNCARDIVYSINRGYDLIIPDDEIDNAVELIVKYFEK